MTVIDGPIQPIPSIRRIESQWVVLGQALFTSPLLSKDSSVSCATCHDLANGGEDSMAVSTGIGGLKGTRNAPSVFNAVFNFRQFWDGRSHDLSDQIAGPIHNPLEMGSNWEEVINKLSKDDYFSHAFKALSEEGVTQANIIKAITIFEESLITPNAPVDRYLLGDKHALSPDQERGLQKFIDYGCVTCHQGRNIGGNVFQKIGRIDRVPKHLLKDKGRYLITENKFDEHVFKVPSLRNIEKTAPYFHDGSVADLNQAIRIMARGQLGLELEDNDVSDLRAALTAFTGEMPASLQ
ncbi:hypothetical protein GCM10007877_39050 [Marinibactrum halimedae]|uniref:Cytochrome c domain-containing protein n=2 Tax=Marinibactrum halimedae TaxID=1444977 RepID=A0AA37T9H1_9GAMM|nr:hypothetical protein GCM10007877_39050 [Marinibactrum halimedae]